MTFDEFRAELARWTFFPGWEFTVAEPICHRSMVRGVLVTLKAQVQDLGGDGWRELSFTRGVTLDQPDHAVLAELEALAFWVARHEAEEWLKRDGRCRVDPHPEPHSMSAAIPQPAPDVEISDRVKFGAETVAGAVTSDTVTI